MKFQIVENFKILWYEERKKCCILRLSRSVGHDKSSKLRHEDANYTYVSMNMIVLYVWICACLQNLIIFIAGVVSWKKTPWPWYSFSFAQHLWVNMVVFRCTNWCWTLVDMNIYFIYMLFLVWTLNKCLTCQLLMIEMT